MCKIKNNNCVLRLFILWRLWLVDCWLVGWLVAVCLNYFELLQYCIGCEFCMCVFVWGVGEGSIIR